MYFPSSGVRAVLIVVVVEEGFFVNVVRIEIAMTAQKMFGSDEIWIVGNVDKAAVQALDVAQNVADCDGCAGADTGDEWKIDALFNENAGHAAGISRTHAAAFANQGSVFYEMLHNKGCSFFEW